MEDKQTKIEKLRQLIDDVNVGMLTSLKEDGEFYSRPMNTMQLDDNGSLFFFSDQHTPDVHDIKVNNMVSVTYTNPETNVYIALNGKLFLSHDQDKIDELWLPACKAWFPEGRQDPNLVLLKVELLKAEYWDSSASDMVVLFNIWKAMAKGKKYNEGDHKVFVFE